MPKSIQTRISPWKNIHLWLFIVIVWWGHSPGQAQPSHPFGIQGNLGLFYDGYNYSATAYDDFRPRFPSDLVRFSAHATLNAGAHFSMPFSVDITNQSTAYHLPSLPEERFIDYVQSPRNNISFNPSYKWVQGYLGTQTPGFSALTTGDIPIFGVGVEMTPGRFLLSTHYGKSQLAVAPDPAAMIAGAFEQRILASRIGWGEPSGFLVALNIVHRKDDTESLEDHPAGIRPQEGITFSPEIQIKLAPSVTLSTETAGSVFTHNLEGPPMPIDHQVVRVAESLLPVNGSSNVDFSNISSLKWQGTRAGLGAEFRYIGPGFEPVGFRAVERDVIDYNLTGNLNLLDNKLMINGSAGIRENNLQSTTAESTTRFIANVNLFTQITESFNLASNYSNFGFNNNVVFDTLRVEMIQNMFSITPGYQLTGENISHVISTTASVQLFDEFNLATGDFINTQSTSFNASYNLVFINLPLNLGVMGMYLQNETPVMDLDMYHVGVTARYRFLEDRLTPSLQISHSGINREGFTTDHRWRANLRTSFEVRPSLELRLGYTYSNYQYGSVRENAVTHEHRMQLSLNQRF